MVELEDGQEEMEGKGSVGGELFVEEEVDFLFADASDLGAVEEAVGDDVEYLAGRGAEDTSEMDGLVAGEGRGGGGPGVGDEAATGHAFEFSWWARTLGSVVGVALGTASLARPMSTSCWP